MIINFIKFNLECNSGIVLLIKKTNHILKSSYNTTFTLKNLIFINCNSKNYIKAYHQNVFPV